MRRLIVFSVLGCLAIAGCGAAPGHEEATTPPASTSLQALVVSRPEARLHGIEGTDAVFDIHVVVSNPNAVAVTMRRVDGQVSVDGQQLATIAVDGAEPVDPSSERAFVFDIRVPLALVMQIRGTEYVATGTLHADGGSGDGALASPFEFRGPIPRL